MRPKTTTITDGYRKLQRDSDLDIHLCPNFESVSDEAHRNSSARARIHLEARIYDNASRARVFAVRTISRVLPPDVIGDKTFPRKTNNTLLEQRELGRYNIISSRECDLRVILATSAQVLLRLRDKETHKLTGTVRGSSERRQENDLGFDELPGNNLASRDDRDGGRTAATMAMLIKQRMLLGDKQM
ncbi:hypothetical protein FANTH_2766 [Fusarium anthophilum]|uniref:Uncharacterized protein n=1 Tax=Fusarium anthophilum TaxID=48485 RepID=A0A8H4ZUF6_9HYPO|nr:hypothetical protein FANTH_2766 [Fusarium anthophilum]